MELCLVLAVCLVTGVISFLLPKEYAATASVLPPVEAGGGRALLGALAAQPGAGAILGDLLHGPTGTKDIFLEILSSRTMQDAVIQKFNLVKVYNLETSRTPMQSAREKLARMTSIRISKRGVISVTVWAYEPKMAADMANFHLEQLDRLNTLINITDAGRSRLFLEGRVAEAQRALREVENRLKEYQGRSKAVVMEAQTRAVVEAAAKLEGQIAAAEVRLKALQTYTAQQHPDAVRLKESIEEMRRQLKRMEYGRNSSNSTAGAGGAAGDFSISLGSVPSTALEMVRLIRETKIQETVFTLLTQQLEQAKIAEAKDTPTVKILDPAVVPEWKSGPKVLENMAIAGLLSLVSGIPLVLLLETRERRRTGETASRPAGWESGKLGVAETSET